MNKVAMCLCSPTIQQFFMPPPEALPTVLPHAGAT